MSEAVAADVPKIQTRIWTENFGTALFVVVMVVFIAFLPALVKVFEFRVVQRKSLYFAFTGSLEEFYLGALAVALTASLNYFESLWECPLGRACGFLAAFSVGSALLSLLGYFLVHFYHKELFDPAHDIGGFAYASMVALPLMVIMACIAVLLARRMRDCHKENADDSG